MGHRDQTVDVPIQCKNSQQVITGNCPTAGDNRQSSEKADFKISGSHFVKDNDSRVMTIKCNIKSLDELERKERERGREDTARQLRNWTLDYRLDNSTVSKLNSLHIILFRKCPCS